MRLTMRIVGVILIITSMLGVNGCMDISLNRSESIKNEILQHMEEKYGVKFNPVSLDQRGIDSSKDEFRCYAEGSNPDTDYAIVYRKGSGLSISYSDTYFGITIRDEYESMITDECKKISPNIGSFSRVQSEIFDEKYNSEKTMEDVINDHSHFCPMVDIFVGVTGKSEEEMKLVSDQMFNLLQNLKISGMYRIYFISPEQLGEINRENYNEFIMYSVKNNILAKYKKIISNK